MEFRSGHQKLRNLTDAVIVSRSDLSKVTSSEQAELWDYASRELIYLRADLRRAVPAEDTDISFLGYNFIDDSLRKWQKHGREEANQAKKKRKAAKEAKGQATKKAKTEEEA